MDISTQPQCSPRNRTLGKRFGVALLMALSILSIAPQAAAHPVPFSYLDVRIEAGSIELTLVAVSYSHLTLPTICSV